MKGIREGLLGLTVLAGAAAVGGLFLWVRGSQLQGARFHFFAQFADVAGLDVGSPVRFRGVRIGRIAGFEPGTGGVRVKINLERGDLAIPRESRIETNQSGFIGTTTIDIVPKPNLEIAEGLSPLAADCDSAVVICQGDVVPGGIGVSFNEVLRQTSAAIAQFNDSQLLQKLDAALVSAEEAAQSVKKLSDSTSRIVGLVEAPLNQFEQTTTQFSDTAEAIAATAGDISRVSRSAEEILSENKARLATTLEGIQAATKEAQTLMAAAQPLLADGTFVANLQKLSENAAATAANLRQLSVEVNNPTSLTALRELLDSARATFANTQKITADLDELTGDPQFRSNIRRLVNGLSSLVSSGTQNLPSTYAFATPEPMGPPTPKFTAEEPAR
ncbi:MAG TPA: MCE family protein [Cyanobacteria bacterium UBA8156]|jgi:phospholipid/cholesterol/gamma-HCH transport system substrate-binding protein|nr:MCE family protein [Cyanobacteria bacterium UBA8156]